MSHHLLEDHVEATVLWLDQVAKDLPPGRAAAWLWALHRWLDAHDTSFTRLRVWEALQRLDHLRCFPPGSEPLAQAALAQAGPGDGLVWVPRPEEAPSGLAAVYLALDPTQGWRLAVERGSWLWARWRAEGRWVEAAGVGEGPLAAWEAWVEMGPWAKGAPELLAEAWCLLAEEFEGARLAKVKALPGFLAFRDQATAAMAEVGRPEGAEAFILEHLDGPLARWWLAPLPPVASPPSDPGPLLALASAWDEALPGPITNPEAWSEALSEAQRGALEAWMEGHQVPVAPLFERLRSGPPWLQLAMAKLLSHHAEWSHQAPEALAWSRAWSEWWPSLKPEALALRDEQGVNLVGHLMSWWRAGGAAVLPDLRAFVEAELAQGRPLGDWWGLSLGMKPSHRKGLREAMAKAWGEAVDQGRLQAVDLGWLEASETAEFLEKRLNWPLEPFQSWLLREPQALAQAQLAQAPFGGQTRWAVEAWIPAEHRARWTKALWTEGLIQLQRWWAEPLGPGWWQAHPQWAWQIVRRGLQDRLLGAKGAAPLGPWLAELKARAEADPESYLAHAAGPARTEAAWQAQHQSWLARGWPFG